MVVMEMQLILKQNVSYACVMNMEIVQEESVIRKLEFVTARTIHRARVAKNVSLVSLETQEMVNIATEAAIRSSISQHPLKSIKKVT